MSSTVKPLDCPWCGHACDVDVQYPFEAGCESASCGARGPMCDDQPAAVEAWNRVVSRLARAPGAVEPGLTCRLCLKPCAMVIVRASGERLPGYCEEHGASMLRPLTTEVEAAEPQPPEPAAWECKVCGAKADTDGRVEHGRGCYEVSPDGGGGSYEEPAASTGQACETCGHACGRDALMAVIAAAEALLGQKGKER